MRMLAYTQLYIRVELEDDVAYTKASFKTEKKFISKRRVKKLLKNVQRAYVGLGRTVKRIELCSRTEYEENVGECIIDVLVEGEKNASR